jgi:3-deoxy-manno-octulosonate cytidylyltransferase (CMP-KDO synthetase)
VSANDFIAVIPARYASERLPGKPLVDIGGKPMIVWVHELAVRSGAAQVIVATDDERIVAACRTVGAAVELTAAGHRSGTDRIAELAARFAWTDGQIVVNVQGDEPLLPPVLIDQVAGLLADNPAADIATLTTAVRDPRELDDPNVVKVITDRSGYALYFSRAAIPFARDGRSPNAGQRHVGLYAYRVRSLRTLAASAPCDLELTEKLEQLRALWLGQRIVVAVAAEAPAHGVDTERDLADVRRIAGQPS